jgi:hypothetical protein
MDELKQWIENLSRKESEFLAHFVPWIHTAAGVAAARSPFSSAPFSVGRRLQAYCLADRRIPLGGAFRSAALRPSGQN